MHMLEYDSKRANVAEGEERMTEVGVGEQWLKAGIPRAHRQHVQLRGWVSACACCLITKRFLGRNRLFAQSDGERGLGRRPRPF